eukprot:791638-Prymnesium_polylepis.1
MAEGYRAGIRRNSHPERQVTAIKAIDGAFEARKAILEARVTEQAEQAERAARELLMEEEASAAKSEGRGPDKKQAEKKAAEKKAAEKKAAER